MVETKGMTLAQLREATIDKHRAGELQDAQKLYATYLVNSPRDAGMWSNLGALHRSEGRYELALAAQRKAQALEPDSDIVRGNLANILNDIGDHDEAISLRRLNIAANSSDQHSKEMLGKSLRAAGRLDEGESVLEGFIKDHPENAELRIQLALTQLMGGKYLEGFTNYGARWDTGELAPRKTTMPQWDLKSPLDGKRILVAHEQGFGDTITFARFIPELRRFNPARVLFAVEGPVERLLSEVEGADWIGKELPPGEEFDTYVNIMDLPLLTFARTDAVPAPTRLATPEDSIARAQHILSKHKKTLNVGLVWQGSQTYRGNAFRSMSHRDLYPLLDLPGVQFFSLYKGPRAADLHADGAGTLMLDVAQSERDFADNAAMMKELDLVITTCTATAHVAGSLGVPTWVMLHWDSFWLWKRGIDQSDWYPSVKLYRQDAPRDWAGVVTRIRADLAKMKKN